MKTLQSAIFATLALTASLGAQAQVTPTTAASAAKASIPSEFTNAEVRKVDKEGKKITLKHEEIKNLGMPPMAMVFQVKDAAVLDKFKAGDAVRFKAIWEAGKYVVVDLQSPK